eukprot:TRINITY_DN10871_c0_g1_i1.p1 TRINITY_DN10871_c0_g1~~TRINITY_DN10871_c0_g1_i1.p1  ORF type:complete len:113 (+),score=9.97 TRINITY_DN10871_c0_g1_i1:47-385(+)
MPSFVASYRARTKGRQFWRCVLKDLDRSDFVTDFEGWFDPRRAEGFLHGRLAGQRFKVIYRAGSGDASIVTTDVHGREVAAKVSKDDIASASSLEGVLKRVAAAPKHRVGGG